MGSGADFYSSTGKPVVYANGVYVLAAHTVQSMHAEIVCASVVNLTSIKTESKAKKLCVQAIRKRPVRKHAVPEA